MCPKSYRLVLLNDSATDSAKATYTVNPVSSDIPQDGLMKVEVEECFVKRQNFPAQDLDGPLAIRMSLSQPCSVAVSSTKGVIRNDLLTLIGQLGTGEYSYGLFNPIGNEVIVPSPYGKDVTITFTDRLGSEEPVKNYTLVLKLTPVGKDHHDAMMY